MCPFHCLKIHVSIFFISGFKSGWKINYVRHCASWHQMTLVIFSSVESWTISAGSRVDRWTKTGQDRTRTSHRMPVGAVGTMATPGLGRSVSLISTGGKIITTGPPDFQDFLRLCIAMSTAHRAHVIYVSVRPSNLLFRRRHI